MERPDNPFTSLDIKYPQARYSDGNIKQKAFFELGSHESQSIPQKERIEILAKFIFEGYDMHKLVNDYLDDKDALDNDTRKYEIASTFRAYANEIFFEPTSNDWRKGVVELLIGDEDKTPSEQMREAIDTFIEVVNVHLKRENLIKPPQVPVYLFRMNYFQKEKDTNDVEKLDAYNVEKLIDDLYENNIVSINVRDKKDGNLRSDIEIIKEELHNENKKQNNIPDYIKQFCNLTKQLIESDVIVVAYYLGKNPKIGLIKQGSNVFTKEKAGEIYYLYCLQMNNVYSISDKRKNVLDTLIPVPKTIIPIKKKAEVIHSIYYNIKPPVKLFSLTDSNLEILCAEYLRYIY